MKQRATRIDANLCFYVTRIGVIGPGAGARSQNGNRVQLPVVWPPTGRSMRARYNAVRVAVVAGAGSVFGHSGKERGWAVNPSLHGGKLDLLSGERPGRFKGIVRIYWEHLAEPSASEFPPILREAGDIETEWTRFSAPIADAAALSCGCKGTVAWCLCHPTWSWLPLHSSLLLSSPHLLHASVE